MWGKMAASEKALMNSVFTGTVAFSVAYLTCTSSEVVV